MTEKDPVEMLRDYAAECCPEHEQYDSYMMRLADEIEAAYMKLPVDADGMTIRPGDKMEMAHFESASVEVVAVGIERWFFDQSCHVGKYDEYDWEWAENSRHVKHETIFDILEELVLRDDLGMLSVEAERDEMDELLTRYAERIRKAVD